MVRISPDLQSLPASLSAAWVSDALATVEQTYRLDTGELLATAGMTPEALREPTALVPLIDVARLFALVLQRTGDEAFGLRLGAAAQVRSFPVLGHAVLGSADLGGAITRLLRYERVVGELGTARLEEDGEDARLWWDCPVPMPYARYVREAAVAGWVAVARALMQEPLAPLAVYFQHAAPADATPHAQVFGCPVHFDAPDTGVVFPRAWLALPLRAPDMALGVIMGEHAARLLADFPAGLNLVNEVRSAIYRRLASGEPAIEDVATDLQLTARALQARLRKAGASYSEIVDGLRRSLAAALVTDERLPLVDVAFLLGFSEQSSFTRAFRRWFGCAPGEYRRQQSGG